MYEYQVYPGLKVSGNGLIVWVKVPTEWLNVPLGQAMVVVVALCWVVVGATVTMGATVKVGTFIGFTDVVVVDEIVVAVEVFITTHFSFPETF